MNGFLIVDKPGGMTSHDVVAKIRRRFATKKVGHAGTLDPMATGVLVIGIGDATRLLQYVVDGRKAYEATISLGAATVTDDVEGEITQRADPQQLEALSDEAILACLAKMIGDIAQRPSSVSAIKVAGKTAHQRVRDGEVFELPARQVHIESISVASIERSSEAFHISISVRCSAGTYIRAIARDLGAELGVGGHLIALRRTEVAPFDLSQCLPWEEAELLDTATGIGKILPIRHLDLAELTEVSFGRMIEPSVSNGVTAALNNDGRFVALLENRLIGGRECAAPTLVSLKE